MMLRIIYVSAGRKLFSDAEIVSLLDVSRRNNRAAGITELMIYHDGSFFQVLEGPEPEVTAVYDRICRDARHHRQILLWQGEVTERVFPNWEMGFSRFSHIAEGDRDSLRSLRELSAKQGRDIPDDIVKLLMNNFLDSFRDLRPG